MFKKSILYSVRVCNSTVLQKLFPAASKKYFYTNRQLFDSNEKQVIRLPDFDHQINKSKDTFLDLIRTYEGRHPQRRGHVEFIYAAMKHMEAFGVDKDLKVYKELINVMPKGKFIPTNIFQVDFMHYPKQQQCMIDLLEKMEDNGVIPDAEMELQLLNIFGNKGHPLRKYWRMMYWMPKFKNLSPWKVPNPAPDDAFDLAKLAIERITSVDLSTVIEVYNSEEIIDSLDKTWIVSGQSESQLMLLNKHSTDSPLIVEAGGRVWLRSKSVNYFLLKSDQLPRSDPTDEDTDDVSNLNVKFFQNKLSGSDVDVPRTVHEQEDGNIYGVCCTGTSSKDSALSWVRLLEKHKCPRLGTLPILFRFKTAKGDLVPYDDSLVVKDDNVKKDKSDE